MVCLRPRRGRGWRLGQAAQARRGEAEGWLVGLRGSVGAVSGCSADLCVGVVVVVIVGFVLAMVGVAVVVLGFWYVMDVMIGSVEVAFVACCI